MVLSKRLLVSAKYLKGFNCLADCGTDHGYLPIYAILNNLVNTAYASDNKIKPLENAKKNILDNNLQDKIETILCDGLPYLNPSIDICAVLGMGGRLISQILDKADKRYLKRMVLAPHSETKILREYLMDNDFQIVFEEIIEDKSKFYQIIVCEPGKMELSDIELEFGPIIIKDKTEVFKKYINKLIHKLKLALPKINSDDEIDRIITRIKILEEVIA